MRTKSLTRLELRMVRTARLLCAGRLPIAIWFPLALSACGIGAVTLIWTSGSPSPGGAAAAAVMAAAGVLGLLDYPLLRLLAKLSADADDETPIASVVPEPAAPWSDVRMAFLVLVPVGVSTIVAALWRLDAVAAPSWTGIAMGAVGGMTIATGILGAAAPRWARKLAQTGAQAGV